MTEARLGLTFCSTACEECPVAELADSERYAVDAVFQAHYLELDNPVERKPLESWAAQALLKTTQTRESMVHYQKVADAVTRIANGNCPHYKEE